MRRLLLAAIAAVSVVASSSGAFSQQRGAHDPAAIAAQRPVVYASHRSWHRHVRHRSRWTGRRYWDGTRLTYFPSYGCYDRYPYFCVDRPGVRVVIPVADIQDRLVGLPNHHDVLAPPLRRARYVRFVRVRG